MPISISGAAGKHRFVRQGLAYRIFFGGHGVRIAFGSARAGERPQLAAAHARWLQSRPGWLGMAPLGRPLHATRLFHVEGGPMTSGMFGDVATSAIYEAMQGLWDEQQSVANNVANIDTPNYKAKDVNFETSLAQAIANGDPSQMQVTTTESTAPSDQAGNNVDLGSEMVQGETAGMQFQTMVDAMNAKFQLLSTAINGPSSSAG
jgi:flagellar basal-body rod protein FlgB